MGEKSHYPSIDYHRLNRLIIQINAFIAVQLQEHTCKTLNLMGTLKMSIKQAGTGPSRRHIQGPKIAKRLPSVKYSLIQYSKIENFSKLHIQKNGRSGAPGRDSASPWRAKRGTRPKLPTFLSQLKGGSFGEKTNFRKSHNAEKLKGGTFWDFKHPICCKISKKLKGDPLDRKKILGKKVSQCRKTERGEPLGFFNIHSDAKQQKN